MRTTTKKKEKKKKYNVLQYKIEIITEVQLNENDVKINKLFHSCINWLILFHLSFKWFVRSTQKKKKKRERNSLCFFVHFK